MKRDLTCSVRNAENAHEPSQTVRKTYQAKLKIPCAVLGIRTWESYVVGVDFLVPSEQILSPCDDFTHEVCAQILNYIQDANFKLDMPLQLVGTCHQKKVWQALRAIPRGATRTYGDLARQIDSGPRAIGRACGDNPIPLFIPCHRVVAKNGTGGFMHHASGDPLTIKAWLLRHEGWLP